MSWKTGLTIRVAIDLPISLPSTSICSGTNRTKRNLTGRETSIVFGMLMAFASLTNAVMGEARQGRMPTRSTAPSAPSSMHARIDSFRSLAFSSTSSLEARRGEDTGTPRSLGGVGDISSTVDDGTWDIVKVFSCSLSWEKIETLFHL